jgi:hypothetical protein
MAGHRSVAPIAWNKLRAQQPSVLTIRPPQQLLQGEAWRAKTEGWVSAHVAGHAGDIAPPAGKPQIYTFNAGRGRHIGG